MHLFQVVFAPVSVYFCNCFSSFLQLFQLSVPLFQFSVLTFFGGKKTSWFDFLTFLGEEMTRVRLKSRRDTVWEKKLTAKNELVDGLIFTVLRFTVYGIFITIMSSGSSTILLYYHHLFLVTLS